MRWPRTTIVVTLLGSLGAGAWALLASEAASIVPEPALEAPASRAPDPVEAEEPERPIPEKPPPELEPDPTPADALPLPAACRGARIREVATLQRVGVFPKNDLGLRIAPHVRSALTGVKDRLVEHVSACLAALPEDAERGAVVATLASSLDTAGVVRGDGLVGALHAEHLGWSAHRKGVMIYTASLALGCGDDDVAIVFERRGGSIVRSLVLRADGYDEIYGGQLGITVALSRGGDDFHVAATSSSPWCTSCWRSIKYSVHTRASDGVFHRAASGRDSAYACSDWGIAADEHAVRFDYLSWDEIGREIRRPRQRAFAVSDGRVTATGPAHDDPSNAVAGFLAEPWAVARTMAFDSAATLEEGHRALQAPKTRWRATLLLDERCPGDHETCSAPDGGPFRARVHLDPETDASGRPMDVSLSWDRSRKRWAITAIVSSQ